MTTEKAKPSDTVIEVETGKELIITTTVPEFITIAEQLNTLRTAYQKIEPDMSTVETRKVTEENWRKFRNVRLALDKAKPEAKAEMARKLAAVEADYKSIYAVLKEFEDKYGNAIDAYEAVKKAEKEALAQKERDRIQMIQEKIRQIQGAPAEAVGYDSATIQIGINNLESISIGEEFGEFLEAAKAAKEAALVKIQEIYVSKKSEEEETERLRLEREAFEKEKEAEAQRKLDEAAEQERIAQIQSKIDMIKNWPRGCSRDSAADLQTILTGFHSDAFNPQDFAEFAVLATQTRTAALAEIQAMMVKQKDHEAAEVQLMMDQQRFAKEQAIADKISLLKAIPMNAYNDGLPSPHIEETIKSVESTDCEGYAELSIAVDFTLNGLRSLLAKVKETELASRQQKEDEIKRKANDERISNIRQLINELGNTQLQPGLPSGYIQDLITHRESRILTAEVYGEFLDEAIQANQDSIGFYKGVLQHKVEEEAETQRLADERAELERQKEAEARRARMETLSAIIEIGEDSTMKPTDKVKQIVILAKREHSKLSEG